MTYNKKTFFYFYLLICSEKRFAKNHWHNFWHTSCPVLLCKFWKATVKRIQNYENGSFWGLKQPSLPYGDLFLENHYNVVVMYLMAPFIMQNFQNIVRAEPELWWTDDVSSLVLEWPNFPEWAFFLDTLLYNFDVPFGLLVAQNLQKILRAAPALWLCVSFGFKMTQFPLIFSLKKH